MKECPICKMKNKDTASFCVKCGENIKTVPAAEIMAETAPNNINTSENMAKSGWDKAIFLTENMSEETLAQKINSVSTNQGKKENSVLIDPDEKIEATIGNGYLGSFLTDGSIGESFGLLTDKRFYFKGKNFSDIGKDLKASTEEGVVALDDITFTKFTHTSKPLNMITALLCGLASFVTYFIHADGGPDCFNTVSIIGAVFAVLLFLRYLITRKTLFLVAFGGGALDLM